MQKVKPQKRKPPVSGMIVPDYVDPDRVGKLDGEVSVISPVVVREDGRNHRFDFYFDPETAKSIGLSLILSGDQALGNISANFGVNQPGRRG